MSWLKRLLCEHVWQRYGSGYDSYVKCPRCDTVKEEAPGDVSSLG
jgi:uncharacterized C2H2 Zn-finger protein